MYNLCDIAIPVLLKSTSPKVEPVRKILRLCNKSEHCTFHFRSNRLREARVFLAPIVWTLSFFDRLNAIPCLQVDTESNNMSINIIIVLGKWRQNFFLGWLMDNMSTVFKYLEVTNHFVAGYENNKSRVVNMH